MAPLPMWGDAYGALALVVLEVEADLYHVVYAELGHVVDDVLVVWARDDRPRERGTPFSNSGAGASGLAQSRLVCFTGVRASGCSGTSAPSTV